MKILRLHAPSADVASPGLTALLRPGGMLVITKRTTAHIPVKLFIHCGSQACTQTMNRVTSAMLCQMETHSLCQVSKNLLQHKQCRTHASVMRQQHLLLTSQLDDKL